MMEFGAKLSLKDNMFATLQRNLKLQREFSEQVDRTNSSIKGLKSVGKTVVYPYVKLKDLATKKIVKVKERLRNVEKTVSKPFVTIKDRASPILRRVKDTLKTVGKTVSKPFVAIKDGATAMLNHIKGGLKSIGSMTAKATVAIKDGATTGLSKISGILSNLAKGVTVGIGLAGAGLTALVGGALTQGAGLEQSIGGVETLFKADAGRVMANADKAFMTAGLSANEYMETVTGFSASLLQSLGGDTAKSAQIADMALIDMADNANKFGTDMSSIQTAYQGFAKQNYTMLDNLKLGYGGTKEEMDRLLKDAQKLTGVKYDISNLADVYSAIHAIQDNLGVAGATAKEASSTFSGSFAMMKASVKNLLGNLALGGDITASMEAVIDSASTFLFDNAIPMLGRIFESLPTAIGVAIEKGAPKMKELGGKIVTALKNGLKTMLPAELGELVDPAFDGLGTAIISAISMAKSVMKGLIPVITNVIKTIAPVVAMLGEMFEEVFPVVQDALGEAFGDGGGFIKGFADIVKGAIPVIKQIILSLAQVFKTAVPAIQPILTTLGTLIQTLFPVIQNIIATFGNIVSTVFPIIASVISTALNAVMPIINALATVVQTAMPTVEQVISTVAGIIEAVMPTISSVFEAVGAKVAEVIEVIIVPVMNLLQQVFETVSPIVQDAVSIMAEIFSASWEIISPIVDLAMAVFDALWKVVEAVFPAIQATVEAVWAVLEPIFGAIADGLGLIGDAVNAVGGVVGAVGDGISTVGGWIGDGIGDVGDFFGFAYGKDRVPYDNYPAVLHEGEKVLTRNQADQYDRSVSTRGVKLNNELQPVEKINVKDAGGLGSAGQSEEVKEVSKAGNNIHIEKLADTVVIEKEADVDKVVEDMVKKFRKLVPNIA